MSSPVKFTSSIGTRKDDINFGPFFKWLKPIETEATIHQDTSRAPREVGKALGFIIDRKAIRANFHEAMEPPHKETMDLAMTLFDRYGRLDRALIDHPVRKGSGVWGDELNHGNFVLLTEVKVDRKWRRKGIGQKLVCHLLTKAMASQFSPKFAFVQPAVYDNQEEIGDDGKRIEEKQTSARRIKIAGVNAFFRSLQFRRVGLTEWFALARSEAHSSRLLSRSDDPDPTWDDASDDDSEDEVRVIVCGTSMNEDGSGLRFTQERLTALDIAARPNFPALFPGIAPSRQEDRYTFASILKRRNPLHYAIKALDDPDGLRFLLSHAQSGMTEDLDTEAINGYGDTILHVAAKESKPGCLRWIFDSSAGKKLAGRRNHRGYTPLEALNAQLERERIRGPYGATRTRLVAEKFNGFGNASVECLLKLSGIDSPTPEQRDRAKFGCNCGQCLVGFLSPRMVKKLKLEAEQLYRRLTWHYCLVDAQEWNLQCKDLLVHLPSHLQTQFKRNAILRKSFAKLMEAVVKCLAGNVIPYKENVVKALKGFSDQSQVHAHYFQKGGTVAALVNIVIDRAKERDSWKEISLKIPELPNCRNDFEFEFARRHCIDDQPPKNEETGFNVDMPWIAPMARMALLNGNIFA